MFSLYATKNLMTGEGGFATTDDDALADRMRLYRNHGMRVRYHHEALGTNFKPTDLAAALGLAQLARLDERTAQRRRNAARLSEGLDGYLTPLVPEGREHVWHQYTMRFPGERQRVIDGLAERGIGTLIYYPVPVHRQAYLQEFVPGRRRPRPARHEPAGRRGAVDPGPTEPRLGGARTRDRRDPRGRHADAAGCHKHREQRRDRAAPRRPRRAGLDGPQPPAASLDA